MSSTAPDFQLRLARTDADMHAAARLRYEVFVAELGGGGAGVDHDQRLERDRFDAYYEHLILLDRTRAGDVTNQIVGVYRLKRSDDLRAGQSFYSDSEFDLSPLLTSGRKLLELGRSCVRDSYRGGTAMHALWQGLAGYVEAHQVDVLFGVASFHGTDPQALAAPLSLLHHAHLASPSVRVRSRVFQPMNLVPMDQIDRRAAMVAVPALIKAYLRLGGTVGDGAFVDHAFNTTDVCLVMETGRMTNAARRYKSAAP